MAKLYFHFGAMNAGKSMILLQAAHNYTERGMKVLLLKPDIDNRDSDDGEIVSRIGIKKQAVTFAADANLEEFISDHELQNDLHCIFLDEAQFLTRDQVWQLAAITDRLSIPVICYGLRTDFQGNLFPGSAALLALADNVREIKTLCWCGSKATMNLRTTAAGLPVKEGDQVEIGGNDRYISLCRKHWRKVQITRTKS
ncbi:MAG: thymidine kinase [Hellea sp.]|nr:thymidine kinase [Hellea sp.]